MVLTRSMEEKFQELEINFLSKLEKQSNTITKSFERLLEVFKEDIEAFISQKFDQLNQKIISLESDKCMLQEQVKHLMNSNTQMSHQLDELE